MFKLLKYRNKDNSIIQAWLDEGLKLPPPEAIKYRKIIDRKKKRKINTIFTTENFISSRNSSLKLDFKKIIDIDQIGQAMYETAIIWLDIKEQEFQKIPEIIDQSFNCINKPEILIDGAMKFMDHDKHPNLWDLKQKVTTEHPGYFFHTHNDIIIISPLL